MKTIKLPRHLIALMVGDNPQAIKAIESLQNGVLELPQKFEYFEKATDEIRLIALQALALANDDTPMLPPVAVCMGDDVPLGAVAVGDECQLEL